MSTTDPGGRDGGEEERLRRLLAAAAGGAGGGDGIGAAFAARRRAQRQRLGRAAAGVGAAAAMVTAAVVVATAGSAGGPAPGPLVASGRPPQRLHGALISFDACSDYLAFVRRQALAEVGPYGLPGDPVGAVPVVGGTLGPVVPGVASGGAAAAPSAAGPSGSATAASGTAAAAFAPGSSTTTDQVPGVDEPDTVKTDGHVVVALAGGVLRVLDTSAHVLGTVALPGDSGGGLLLAGDRVVVLSAPDGGSQARAAIIDIATPSHPELVRTFLLDGTVVAARLVGGDVRLVDRTDGPRLGTSRPSPDQGSDAATAANRAAIASSTVADWLPAWQAEAPDGARTARTPIAACDAIARPVQASGVSTVTVATIDPASATLGTGSGVVAAGSTVYATATHLYVAASSSPPQPVPPPEGLPFGGAPAAGGSATGGPVASGAVSPAAGVASPAAGPPGSRGSGGAVGSPPAGGAGVGPVPGEPPSAGTSPGIEQVGCCTIIPPEGSATQLYAFATPAGGPPLFTAAGRVPGWLLGSYAIDDDGTDVRVVSTERTASGGTDARITVLAARGQHLDEVGAVDGLGAGEAVRAVRFAGDRAYVVTYRSFDPLYVVDLHDATHPAVAGELDQPGFSEFLYPLPGDRLFGVGVDVAGGEPTGLVVATYDVHDPAHPARIATAPLATGLGYGVAGGAGFDPHTFVWWAPSDLALLATPSPGWYDTGSATGVAAFGVGPAALTRLATIGHGTETATRAAVVDGTVWVLTGAGVVTAPIGDLTGTAWHPW